MCMVSCALDIHVVPHDSIIWVLHRIVDEHPINSIDGSKSLDHHHVTSAATGPLPRERDWVSFAGDLRFDLVPGERLFTRFLKAQVVPLKVGPAGLIAFLVDDQIATAIISEPIAYLFALSYGLVVVGEHHLAAGSPTPVIRELANFPDVEDLLIQLQASGSRRFRNCRLWATRS